MRYIFLFLYPKINKIPEKGQQSTMVQVSRTEANYIRKAFPKVHITKTCKKKNDGSHRGKYYVEENPRVMNYLRGN